MKTTYYCLCWLLVAVVAFSAAAIIDDIPVTNDGYASHVYDSWSGVIRVWCVGGWKPGNGSFKPWLNKVASRFEKRNPGVRVQVSERSEEELSTFTTVSNPPDVILFPPGEISGDGLSPLDNDMSVREELRTTGMVSDETRAIPVAMGGYAWAVNKNLIKGVPYDWSELSDLEKVRNVERYILDVPADSRNVCWSGGVNALMAPRRVYETRQNELTSDLDIGFPFETPQPSVEPESRIIICQLPRTIRNDFRTRDSVYGDFTSGRIAAIPVTQSEIRSLLRLSQSGKGISWSVEAGGGAFSDQILFAAIPDCDKSDFSARNELSKHFIKSLISEEAQKDLVSIRAISVTGETNLYSGQYGMSELEKAVTGIISVPNAFDDDYRERERLKFERLIIPE